MVFSSTVPPGARLGLGQLITQLASKSAHHSGAEFWSSGMTVKVTRADSDIRPSAVVPSLTRYSMLVVPVAPAGTVNTSCCDWSMSAIVPNPGCVSEVGSMTSTSPLAS
ncbi:unannotated protein [freshwater metagenome]|uniref:Unannotated protein n=1 Tax=freshwater metagenome TaxID=449393 RepID=A0A6J6DMR0_9ZZZZ